MFKIPEFLDVWKINETTVGVIFDIRNNEIEMICKDTITGETYFTSERINQSKDSYIRYETFNRYSEYIGKSKILDKVFEVKND